MIMGKIRIGTRESQLAIWQATQVKELLAQHGFESELVFIKSEGDIDLVTPLYEIGVQGIFTRSLDAALLSNKIDVAVHSLKDVPTQLPKGVLQAAVLKRGRIKMLGYLADFKDKKIDKSNSFFWQRFSKGRNCEDSIGESLEAIDTDCDQQYPENRSMVE